MSASAVGGQVQARVVGQRLVRDQFGSGRFGLPYICPGIV